VDNLNDFSASLFFYLVMNLDSVAIDLYPFHSAGSPEVLRRFLFVHCAVLSVSDVLSSFPSSSLISYPFSPPKKKKKKTQEDPRPDQT